MIRVIGSERVSAFLKSSSKAWDSALSALASPNWPTKTPRFCWAARSTAATTGSMVFSVRLSSPRSSKVTSAERPSLEIWSSALPAAYGEATSATPGCLETPATTSSTALRTAASRTEPPSRAWTRTLSSASFGKASLKILSARPDSPT